jgi:hypothetical protein
MLEFAIASLFVEATTCHLTADALVVFSAVHDYLLRLAASHHKMGSGLCCIHVCHKTSADTRPKAAVTATIPMTVFLLCAAPQEICAPVTGNICLQQKSG